MAKRIKLLVDITGVDEGISHLVYRSDASPVATTQPIMVANEKESTKRSLSKVGERLVQDKDNPLSFLASRVYMMMPAPKVYVDGVEVLLERLRLNPKEKRIYIDQESLIPNTPKVITMDYNYLATVLVDDKNISQLGVQYLSDRVITGLNPPVFIKSTFDKMKKSYTLRIARDTTEHEAWYKVVTRDERTGTLSEASDDQKIGITPNEYDLKYRLDVSKDNQVTWQFLTFFSGKEIELQNVADITNAGHSPLMVDVNRLSPESAEVILQNPWYAWESNGRATHHYRIREEDGTGQVSEYTVLPETSGINYKPLSVKIRRKESNGTPATFSGTDAIDMWTLSEDDVDVNTPTVRLVDDHLVAGKEYSYTIYIDDEEQFRSAPFMALTT